MKMIIAKLKRSTIAKTITTIIFSISLVFCNVIPVFGATAVDQESLYPILKTSGTTYLYPVTGNSKTVTRYTTITDLLAQYADQSTLNQKNTYTLLNGTFKGYIDGIETTLSTIDTKLGNISSYVDGVETGITNINTYLTNIKSYVDGLEGYVDGLEGYVDGLETAFTTNNTRLNEIKTAINNITTYNYTQVLSDILTNTGYLSTIDTYTLSIQDSIGYGTTGDNVLSKLTSIINKTENIKLNTDSLKINSDSIVDQFAVGNHTFKVLSFGSTQYTPDNSNRTISIIDNSPTSMGYIGYRANNTGSYSLYSSTVNTMGNRLSIMNNNLLQLFTAVYSANTFYRFGVPNYTNGSITGLRSYSLMDSISGLQHQASQFFARMGFVLADDDTITAKNANINQEQAVLTNFTGSGSASASASDFGDIASGVASVNSGLNTGVSISNIFNIYNNRDGYGFWSVETQNELNTTNASRSYKSSRGSSTPLYDSKLSEIYSYMGVNHD